MKEPKFNVGELVKFKNSFSQHKKGQIALILKVLADHNNNLYNIFIDGKIDGCDLFQRVSNWHEDWFEKL